MKDDALIDGQMQEMGICWLDAHGRKVETENRCQNVTNLPAESRCDRFRSFVWYPISFLSHQQWFTNKGMFPHLERRWSLQ